MKQIRLFSFWVFILLAATWVMGQPATESAFQRRDVLIFDEAGLPFPGVSYGPFRGSQRPGGEQPTRAQIAEDMEIVARHWKMLRLYGSDPFAETVCSVIQEQGIDLKVMVGAWVVTESTLDVNDQLVDILPACDTNRKQVDGAIRLANKYPGIVVAVNVGNECLVSWSFHAMRPQRLIAYVKQVRSQTKVPVTVADDFMFWVTPASREVAEQVDFIVMHGYGMWHAQPLDNAVPFLQEKYAEVKKSHPDHLIVIGETGWATKKPTSGDQANRLQGEAGELQQSRYFEELTLWATQQRVPLFYFEAFDEPWKGGNDPLDAEKHWGLFRGDRTPKAALRRLDRGRRRRSTP